MRHFSSAQIDGSGSRPIDALVQRPTVFPSGSETEVLVLILAATLPLFQFTIGVGATSYRDNFQRKQEELAHIANVMLVAMDKELSFGLRVAETLTRSAADNFDNVSNFDTDARGLIATQSQITMVSLSDLESGELLSRTTFPPGRRAPISSTAKAQNSAVIKAGRSVVFGVRAIGVELKPFIPISSPVVRDGSVRRVVNMGIATDVLDKTVAAIPGRWIGAIVGPDFRIAARNRESKKFVGRSISPAAKDRFQALVEAEAVAPTKTGNSVSPMYKLAAAGGGEIYRLVLRSSETGWFVTAAIPSEEIDGPIWHYAALIGLFGLGATGTGGAVSYRIMRRIRRLRAEERQQSIVLEGEVIRRTAALAASEGRLSAILSSVADMVVTIDERGCIQSFNPAAERAFGYRAEEVIGMNVSMLASEPDRCRHDGYLRDYLNSGVGKMIGRSGRHVTATRKDGSSFPIELTVGETRIEGNRVFIGTMRDITERRALEAALAQGQKMEAVGQLTGGLAHDFNNLLAVVIGNLDLLDAHLAKDSIAAQFANSARDSGLRGAALVRQLLAFSRRQQLRAIPFDLNQAVHDVSDLLKHTLGEKIIVKFALTDDLDTVLVDRAQLESAIVNLAVNARDAMPTGGTLAVETGHIQLDDKFATMNPDIRAGNFAMLAVSDTGMGMTPEVLERVFEPFFTTKEEGRGSGLGLSMVYGFIKQSNGHIRISSEPGRGTTVKIFLPISDRIGSSTQSKTVIPSLIVGQETILLVEDKDDVRQTVSRQLAALGYQVWEAANAAEALALLEGGARPDLLLTDVVMPGGMDGYELAARAVRRWPDLKVLCTSGYDDAAVTGSHDHTFPFLSKPYRMDDLAARLRQVLGQG